MENMPSDNLEAHKYIAARVVKLEQTLARYVEATEKQNLKEKHKLNVALVITYILCASVIVSHIVHWIYDWRILGH